MTSDCGKILEASWSVSLVFSYPPRTRRVPPRKYNLLGTFFPRSSIFTMIPAALFLLALVPLRAPCGVSRAMTGTSVRSAVKLSATEDETTKVEILSESTTVPPGTTLPPALSAAEAEKVGNLVADDEYLGLGMELAETVRIAVLEDVKKNARDFLGKDDYKACAPRSERAPQFRCVCPQRPFSKRWMLWL